MAVFCQGLIGIVWYLSRNLEAIPLMKPISFAEFWRQLPVGETVHPADRPILDNYRHSLTTHLRPAFGQGPLATAPVVLCYLNNKFTEEDEARNVDPLEAVAGPNKHWGEYLAGIIEGARPPLPFREWSKARIHGLESLVAIFNIVPYRSRGFKQRRLARKLPSALMACRYLHEVLLPAAARNDRFVVIMWGAKLWGVDPAQDHETLKVFTNNRAGYLPDELRKRIQNWARQRDTGGRKSSNCLK